MLRFLVVFTLAYSLLLSREKIIMFPSKPTNHQAFLSENAPNPSVRVWGKIKKCLDAKGFDLIVTETNKIKPETLQDPSVKYYFFHNPFKFRLSLIPKIPKEKRVLWIWEPAVAMPQSYAPWLLKEFSYVFTFDDTLLNRQNYVKFYHPHNIGMIKTVTPFKERRFLCLMNAKKKSKAAKIKWKNYYAERLRVIRFYERCKPGELHLYGRGWKRRPSARGCVPNKIKTIKNYKFCICYENTNTPGYVSEKIFDCFQAGVVPVYLGAENVTETIPENCFIDRRKFEDDEAVYQFMKAMDEKTYEEYLKNIREYLASEKGYLYTEEHFINSFVDWVTKS
ncbi:MAG: hypothetical protein H7A39_03385 [Chlamydiales bacterium]|nr:hypothetical protein [Chlamydiales bacterium]